MTGCQFSPEAGEYIWEVEILSYSQLTHRDRKSVCTEVTKTQNARAISNDCNTCLASIGPSGEDFPDAALIQDGDVHALRATPYVGVVGARVTNLDDQTATTVIIYVKTRHVLYPHSWGVQYWDHFLLTARTGKKSCQGKGEVYFPACYQTAESRRGTGHGLSGH